MPEITLTAEVGRRTGSRDAGRLRTEGKIPGILYGHGIDPVPVAIDGKEFRAAMHTDAGTNQLLNLRLSDGGQHLALAKDIQRHPVRNVVTHVDFIVVSRDEQVTSDVPITLVGEATKALRADGVVDQQHFTIALTSRATDIPNSIEIDVTDLRVGDVIRVSDLKLPTGATTNLDPDEAVVSVLGPQVDQIETEAADAETEAREDADDSTEAAADVVDDAEAARAVAEGETPEGTDAPSEA